MLPLALALLLTAQPQDIPVGAPGLSYVGMSQAQGDVYLDYLTQQLALEGGIRVITRSDVAAIVGLERQKQLLGCAEGAESCLAELAGALGVSALMTGSLATASTGFVLNLKVIEAGGTNRPIGIYSVRVKSEDALFDLLEASARDLAGKLRAAFAPSPTRLSARRGWWIPAAAGVALLAAGGVTFGVAKSHESRIATGDPSITTREQLALLEREAPVLQSVGFVLGGVGLAALLAGAGLALFGDAGPAMALELSPGALSFNVLLRWP